MPTYCYEKPDGSIVEKIMTIAEMEKFDRKPVVDGETWKRRIDVEMGGHSDLNDRWCQNLLLVTRVTSLPIKHTLPSTGHQPTLTTPVGQCLLAAATEQSF